VLGTYVLDLWFEKKIKRKMQNQTHLVRYADDFVILLRKPEEMNEMLAALKAGVDCRLI
jgi:retron-type reverse transcriptase